MHPKLDRPRPIMPGVGASVRSIRQSNYPQLLDSLAFDYA
jgi:hypothetical protein